MTPEITSALALACSKVTWPRFMATAVVALFTFSFDHVDTWAKLIYLLCLGFGAVVIYAFAAWLSGLLEDSGNSRSSAQRRRRASALSKSAKSLRRRAQTKLVKT
jgi:hypothetical protein